MPEADVKALAVVRRELEKNPAVNNADLRAKVAGVAPSVMKLSLRQFHGVYRLRVARALKAAAKRGSRRRPVKGRTRSRSTAGRATRRKTAAAAGQAKGAAAAGQAQARAAVRGILLDLAREVAAAEASVDLIGVIGSLDRYVDPILAALSPAQRSR